MEILLIAAVGMVFLLAAGISWHIKAQRKIKAEFERLDREDEERREKIRDFQEWLDRQPKWERKHD